MKDRALVVNEVYVSVQGESTFAGLPCVFVRLTACDLRCSYCDTEYAFYEGKKRLLENILEEIRSHQIPLVEITGGEPLLQKNVLPLMKVLCDEGFDVLIETSGAHDISQIDSRVHCIMDLKCPDSGMEGRNRYENISCLKMKDEVKFVIASRNDYEWSRQKVREFELQDKVRTVLFSAVFGKCEPQALVEWIVEDKLPVRFQLQMHKFIWEPKKRGV
ncbi:MAG: radical SAM protein [Verrucomicrobiota bacterium]